VLRIPPPPFQWRAERHPSAMSRKTLATVLLASGFLATVILLASDMSWNARLEKAAPNVPTKTKSGEKRRLSQSKTVPAKDHYYDPPPCPYSCGGSSFIYAYDSSGDGWSGATITVSTCDGTELLSATTLEGECGYFGYFCFNNSAGDPLNVTLVAGSSSSEVSWQLYNENGANMEGAPGDVDSGTVVELSQCACFQSCGGSSYIFAQDSWGDGWSGATITVSSCDGTELLSATTLEAGLCGSGNYFCFDNSAGHNLVVTVVAGTWSSEVSWQLFNENGDDMAGAPGDVDSGTVVVDESQCYTLVTSKFCANHLMIASKTECAAVASMLDYTWTKSHSNSNRPGGCYLAEPNNKVFYNTNPSFSTCTSKFPCICKPPFVLKRSGSCDDAQITDKKTCMQATKYMELTWYNAKKFSSYPSGCFSTMGSRVFFNKVDNSGVSCSADVPCLCKGS